MIQKKHLTPLTKRGNITVQKGKGDQSTGMPTRGQLTALSSAPGASMNNYAKVSPVSQPAGAPTADPNMASGDSPGVGF
jgi:hypothetical protein